MDNKITVRLAQVQDLQTIHISAKSLGDLLKAKNIEYNSSVRVNGEVKPAEYRLRNNDIITVVDAVSGGR
jgi:sulfur carrier protein ThiS